MNKTMDRSEYEDKLLQLIYSIDLFIRSGSKILGKGGSGSSIQVFFIGGEFAFCPKGILTSALDGHKLSIFQMGQLTRKGQKKQGNFKAPNSPLPRDIRQADD